MARGPKLPHAPVLLDFPPPPSEVIIKGSYTSHGACTDYSICDAVIKSAPILLNSSRIARTWGYPSSK